VRSSRTDKETYGIPFLKRVEQRVVEPKLKGTLSPFPTLRPLTDWTLGRHTVLLANSLILAEEKTISLVLPARTARYTALRRR